MASFEKSQNGMWSVRFRFFENGATKNKRLSGFRTKKEAEKAFAKYVSSYKHDPSKIGAATFSEVYEEWLAYKKDSTKTGTYYTYESFYNAMLKDYFGAMQLDDITPLVIKEWQSLVLQKGYSKKYYKNIRNTLNNVFIYLQRYYNYPNNPIAKTEPLRFPNEKKKEKQVWSVEQFNEFIEYVDDEPYHALFIFLFYTGCRKAEALALTWDDIDFDNATVTINKTYTRKIKGVTYAIENTPKTASSIRTIKLPCVVINALKSPYFGEKTPFVFGGETPLPENTLRKRLERYLDKATIDYPSLPRLTFHEFRHSHASLLISNGISIVTVSKRLGHSSINETLKTYAHLMENDEAKSIALLNKLSEKN